VQRDIGPDQGPQGHGNRRSISNDITRSCPEPLAQGTDQADTSCVSMHRGRQKPHRSPPVGALIAKTNAALLSATEEDGCEVCTPMHVILKLIHDMCSYNDCSLSRPWPSAILLTACLTPGSLHEQLATNRVSEHPLRSSDTLSWPEHRRLYLRSDAGT
jgi:hypothetical protein